MTILIPLAVLLVLAILWVLMFNTMVQRRNQVQYAYAGIDAQLKKRFDLIPNLVATVKRYAEHEKKILVELTVIRSRAVNGITGPAELSMLDGQLTSALRSVSVIAENYPQLRASEVFENLQRSLNETEEQIAASRRAYNAAVTDYNNACQMFPLSIVAGRMRCSVMPWFEIPEDERVNPDIERLL